MTVIKAIQNLKKTLEQHSIDPSTVTIELGISGFSHIVSEMKDHIAKDLDDNEEIRIDSIKILCSDRDD